MDSVNKTLYIPLYGKAFVSRSGILLEDKMAERIWEDSGFELTGKSASKWLAYSMAMRAAVFDRWTARMLEARPEAVVLHLGCGLDSRCQRVGGSNLWYDVDFPEVIGERQKYFEQTANYRMIGGDLRQEAWLAEIPEGNTAIVAMEGVSMYLAPEELETLLRRLRSRFSEVHLLMDCYSTFAAMASKHKNPVKEVGVSQVYGLDFPQILAGNVGYRFLREHAMAPTTLIRQLKTGERILFSNLYAGKTARKLYRIYELDA